MADDKASVDFREERRSAEALNEISQISTFLTDTSENPLFVKDLDYTREEEAAVIRILDTRLFPWILLTTFVLNMDGTNNSNAISDNLPADLGFNIDAVNLATALYSVVFSIFTLTGAVIAKLAGPQLILLPPRTGPPSLLEASNLFLRALPSPPGFHSGTATERAMGGCGMPPVPAPARAPVGA